MQLLLSMAQDAANRILSGVFGSISMTAWMCLLLPQLIQNYKSQSADGLSMAFLFVWLVGDIANLCGALFTHLAPPAIALAVYFCLADLVLILQSSYYNAKNSRLAAPTTRRTSHRGGDDAPLLGRRGSSAGLPGSHRRHSRRRSASGFDPLTRIFTGEDETPDSSPWLHNILSLAAVWIVGALGYFATAHMGLDLGSDDSGEGPSAGGTQHTVGMALGYLSAVCYLCARIPQIVKNYREKSCEGLALLFFLLSLTGNLTYGASLVAYSQTREELIKDLPWLVGSLGTIVEDLAIFVQFRIYGDRAQTKPGASEDAEHAENGNGNGAVYGTA